MPFEHRLASAQKRHEAELRSLRERFYGGDVKEQAAAAAVRQLKAVQELCTRLSETLPGDAEARCAKLDELLDDARVRSASPCLFVFYGPHLVLPWHAHIAASHRRPLVLGGLPDDPCTSRSI
jgi:hypothetical protein